MIFRLHGSLLLIAIMMWLAMPVESLEYNFNKAVVPHVLQQELKDAGYRVDYIMCAGTACRIVLPDTEKKNPAAVVAAHKGIDPKRERLKAILESLRKGAPISQKDRDDALMFLLDAFIQGRP